MTRPRSFRDECLRPGVIKSLTWQLFPPASAAILAFVIAPARWLGSTNQPIPVSPVLVGIGGMSATLLSFFATHSSMLATVAVLTSLYLGGTVLLARMILHERFSAAQRTSLGLCTLVIVAIALN